MALTHVLDRIRSAGASEVSRTAKEKKENEVDGKSPLAVAGTVVFKRKQSQCALDHEVVV